MQNENGNGSAAKNDGTAGHSATSASPRRKTKKVLRKPGADWTNKGSAAFKGRTYAPSDALAVILGDESPRTFPEYVKALSAKIREGVTEGSLKRIGKGGILVIVTHSNGDYWKTLIGDITLPFGQISRVIKANVK
jgi:hypothetical protein